jgi:hypothetical protein
MAMTQTGYVVIRNGQKMSVTLAGLRNTDLIVREVWAVTGGGGSGSGGGGSSSDRFVSSSSTPTPSAGSLTGTAEQRQAQIDAFRERQSINVAYRERAAAAKSIREAAASRGIDISTEAKERKFIKQLEAEAKSQQGSQGISQEALLGTQVPSQYDIRTAQGLKNYARDYGVTNEEINVYTRLGYNRSQAIKQALYNKQTQTSWLPGAIEFSEEKKNEIVSPYGKELLTGTTAFGAYKEAQKLNTDPLSKSVYGGVGLVKAGIYAPFMGVEKLFGGTGKELTKRGYGWTGAGFNVATMFVPSTPLKHAELYGFTKAIKFLGPVADVGFTAHGAYGLQKGGTKEEIILSSAELVAGALPTTLKGIGMARTKLSFNSPKQYEFESVLNTPLRERATVILKNTSGKILYHIDTKTGTYMLPGGKIETGESALKAAQRELFEETGIKNIKLTYKDTIITSEQKHYVFEGELNKGINLKNLKPQAKEVGGFKLINPPKYSGATALEPFGRVPNRLNIFDKRIVRSEDLFIGSKSKFPDLKQTELIIQKPQEAFMRRGESVYLSKRVGKYSPLKLVGYKTGQFYKFQKGPGIVVAFGSRYDIPYVKMKPYFDKKLWYTHGSPGRIVTEIKIESVGKPKGFGDISSGDYFKIRKEYMKRGEKVFYLQPPTTGNAATSKSYLGATYLNLYRKPKPDYGMGVKFRLGSPSIYRYKATLGKDLISTERAKRGQEFEAGAVVGKEFRVEQNFPSTYLAGKNINIYELKTEKRKISIKEQNKINKEVKLSKELEYYEGIGRRPKTIYEVGKDLISSSVTKSYKYKSSSTGRLGYYTTKGTSKEGEYPITTYKKNYSGISYKTTGTTSSRNTPFYKTPYSYSYKTSRLSDGGGGTYYPPPPSSKSKLTSFKNPFKFSSKPTSPAKTGSFSVFIRRRGKFRPVSTGLTLGRAFEIGTGKVRKTLAATFLVKQQGGTYRGKTPKGFYSKPTRLGTIYIQKRKFRLSAPGEKSEIKLYRK